MTYGTIERSYDSIVTNVSFFVDRKGQIVLYPRAQYGVLDGMIPDALREE